MSKIAEKKQQINEIRSYITDFMDNREVLENEVTDMMLKVQESDKEYEQYILNGEHDKADKHYRDTTNLREDLKVKEKRLMSMKRLNDNDVVIKKWNEIKNIANSLPGDYMTEHQDLVDEYIETKVKAENLKRQLNNVQNEVINYNVGLSYEQDEHFKRIGVRNIPMIFSQHQIFGDEYLEQKEKQYKLNQ